MRHTDVPSKSVTCVTDFEARWKSHFRFACSDESMHGFIQSFLKKNLMQSAFSCRSVAGRSFINADETKACVSILRDFGILQLLLSRTGSG